MKSPDHPVNVLITGASGNLARKLVSELQAHGLRGQSCNLLLTDLTIPANLTTGPGLAFEQADLATPDVLRKLVASFQPDYLLHFGSLLSGASEQNIERAWHINGTASIVLLEAAAALPHCVFFFPSTGASYGAGVSDPLPENEPQWPGNFYGVTKIAVERAGTYLQKKRGLDFRCLRFPMVLSPSAPTTAVTAYASHAFVAARAGRSFVFPVSPGTGISTIYIKDVISGIRQFLDVPRERLTKTVYNVHAFGPSAEEIAAEIQKHLPQFQFSFAPDAFVDGLLGGWPKVHLDQSARTDWGWAPRFDLAATAADMLQP